MDQHTRTEAMNINTHHVQRHYASATLFDKIVEALQRVGANLDRLSPDDLAPVDEFHPRGRAATIELAQLVGFAAGESVLDVGSGLGGPSRFLADTYRCTVTGIDLTLDFVFVAKQLARLVHLEGRVAFAQADALALPFAAATFDVVWSQNMAMNIADRPRLYAEIRRVLRPGGRYVFSDVVAGTGGEPLFPVPWARGPDTSYLLSESDTRATLERAGFRLVAWESTTARSSAAAAQRAATPVQALGLHLLFGTDWPAIGSNMLRNYREQRIGTLHAVAVAVD